MVSCLYTNKSSSYCLSLEKCPSSPSTTSKMSTTPITIGTTIIRSLDLLDPVGALPELDPPLLGGVPGELPGGEFAGGDFGGAEGSNCGFPVTSTLTLPLNLGTGGAISLSVIQQLQR